QDRTSPRTRIIWGATVDPSLGQKMRVLVILTGIVLPYIHGEKSILKRIQTDLDVVK
ncbi:MAG TPA: cell division protein FtsZ, partial [Aciduliprofundum sp.]|nr:cell division protein FtsZ [Aciduliprofundum sp.]